MAFEYDLIRFLQANASPNWISFFQTVTLLGSYLGLLVTFIIVFAKNRKYSFALLLTFAVGSVLNHILKSIVARARPFDVYLDIINFGGEDGFSFPSGHSLCAGIYATFLFFTLIKSTKNKWTIFLGGTTIFLTAMLVILSRMVLGVHFLTDVLTGFILGVLFALIGIWVSNIIEKYFKKYKK